jgi:hypothetical protein
LNNGATQIIAENNGLTYEVSCAASSSTATLTLRAYNTSGVTAYFGNEATVQTSANLASIIYQRACSNNCNPDIIQPDTDGTALTDSEATMINLNGRYLALEIDSLLVANRLNSGNTCAIAGTFFRN